MTKISKIPTENKEPLIVLSIGHAHSLAQDANKHKKYDIIQQLSQIVIEQDEIVGEADDYHNLSIEFSLLDDYADAFRVVEKGLKQYPYNIDLLADAVYYGSNSMQYEECEKYVQKLNSVPFARWNWRAYTFLVNYYINKADWTDDIEQAFAHTEQALKIAMAHQAVFPKEEKGYLSEYKVRMIRERFYLAGNNNDEAVDESKKAEEALKRAIDSEDIPAVQCCMQYADYLFKKQRYNEVILICDQALKYGESQPTARLSYFLYLSGLSKDSLIHREKAYWDEAKVREAFADYIVAYNNDDRPDYKDNIITRASILAAKSSLPLPEELDKNRKVRETDLSGLLNGILK